MDTNIGSMIAAFLIPILLFVAFLITFRKSAEQHRSIHAQLETLTEETNSLLREILTELKRSS